MDRRSACRVLGASAVSLLLFGARSGRAQEGLDRPRLLVATPDLDGPYRRTALLAAPLGDKHIGFILNRASEVRLATLFPDLPTAEKIADPVYIGGPEMAGALFALLPRDPGGKSLRLFGEVYVTGETESLQRIIAAQGEARFFAGFVGWTPGELAQEIADGCWYVAEPAVEPLFRRDTGTLWEELVRRARALQA